MKTRITRWLSTMTLLMLSGTALAHHSFAMFDSSQMRELQGTVRRFEFNYPHTWVWINVPDDKGGSAPWGFESTAPVELNRISGWTRTSLKVGDKITIKFHPLKNGKNGGALTCVTSPDGRVLAGQAAVCGFK